MLFIPLSDDNPLKVIRYQWVTIGIIAVNVVVFILQISGLGLALGTSLAVIPSELFQVHVIAGSANGPFDAVAVPEALTLVTYMFLHTDVIHLASNMMFLWVFGDNVEDAVGHLRYLAFYLLCGIAAALTQAMMQPASQLPLIGASGAVAGTIAAYLILHPRVLVWVLAFRIVPLRVTATWILGLWVATQLFMILINRGDQVAWWAHIGGVIAGALLIPLMRRPDIPLFDRGAEPVDSSRDAWWRDYRAGLFHRGLLRLRNPVRSVTALARYARATGSRGVRWVKTSLQPADIAPEAPAAGLAPPTPRTFDIVAFEQRGEDFALVRIQANGSRSEIVLTAANVVHLGLLAPGFARQVLTDKVGQQPGAVANFIRNAATNVNLRFIEIVLNILERGGGRLDFPRTERRARELASRLVERADRISAAPAKTAKELR